MRVLLDTHTFFWALADPKRLGPTASQVIRSRSTELVVSTVSAWELATKVRIGKMPSAVEVVHSYGEYLDRLGASALPISSRHALLAGSMRWEHRDPFDRMLAAQAMIEDLTLISADPAFSSLAGLRLRW